MEKGYRGEHHSSKVKFHQLINSDALAGVSTLLYDGVTRHLTLRRRGGGDATVEATSSNQVLLDVDLRTDAGVREAEACFDAMLGDAVKPSADGSVRLRLVRAADGITHQFANVGGTQDMLLLHLINRESVHDLEARTGRVIDPHRFRANFIFEGMDPWCEWDWPGQRVRLGGATLLITEPTIRCPATEVGMCNRL